MVRKRTNPHALISLAEAERAIYFDCEGFKNAQPSIVGILMKGQFEQIVVDPALTEVALAKGHRMSTFVRESEQLVTKARAESRRIVAYSQHERNLFDQYASLDLVDLYGDARMIAKRWKNKLHKEAELHGRGLKDFLEFIEYPIGSHLGDRKTTKRLRAVRDMVARKGSFDKLTPTVKGQWTKLLEHNRIDSEGMRALVLQAARELEMTT